MSAAAAFMVILGLALLVFFFFAVMKNAKGTSSNPITNIVNNLTGKNLTSRFQGIDVTKGVSQGEKKPQQLQVSGSGSSNQGVTGGTTAPVTLKKQKKDCSKEPNVFFKATCEFQNLLS